MTGQIIPGLPWVVLVDYIKIDQHGIKYRPDYSRLEQYLFKVILHKPVLYRQLITTGHFVPWKGKWKKGQLYLDEPDVTCNMT
jgi:hypothetical protein